MIVGLMKRFGLMKDRQLPIRSILIVGLLLAVGSGFNVCLQQAQAQGGPTLRSVDKPVRVALDPTYQYYETEEGQVLNQLSTQLTASVPVGQRVQVQARAGYAQMGGEGLKDVGGLTDAKGRVSYAQPVGEGSVVISATVNAPVGKQKLDSESVATTLWMGQNLYDFRVTSFSRGLSVSPQMTWAFPVSDRWAVGLGAGYQHQRGFRPQADMQADYVPGDGVGANGGFDYKVTETSAVGLDLAYKRYRPDRLGGDRRFRAGNRLAGTVRYLHRSGFTTIRAVGRYASWEESEFGYQFGADSPDRGQVIPSHGMTQVTYQGRMVDDVGGGGPLRMEVRISGHWYGSTVRSDETLFGRVGVSPSIAVTDGVTIAPHGRFTYGSYLGVGGGLRVEGEF